MIIVESLFPLSVEDGVKIESSTELEVVELPSSTAELDSEDVDSVVLSFSLSYYSV